MRILKVWIVISALCAFSCFGDIQIQDPKARATFALAQTGALYFTLVNDSQSDDVLVAVSVPPVVAQSAELHEVIMVNEMMRMQQISEGISVQANSKVELAPGRMHVMLLGLQQPLKEGEVIDVTLSFENAGTKIIKVPVVSM